MKKIMLFSALMAMLFAVMVASATAQNVLSSANTAVFGASVSTTATTGRLIANTVEKARIVSIDVNWEISASSATLILYDNLEGANSKVLYRTYIPASTSATVNRISKIYPTMPLLAKKGLFAVLTDGSQTKVVVCVDYW